ncbi:MAG: periplasmic heavy metal sensor [Alphaproteobacteria bacterium]|nr:periplasmic heavy metal sensor [Alphaproteobacteria bacterium]
MSATALLRPPRPRALLLGLSVALNVFLIAMIGAHLLAASFAPAAMPRSTGQLGKLIAALPEPDAARARAVLERERPFYQPARDHVSAANGAVAAAIAKTPYDEAGLREALAAWQTSWQGFATRFNVVFLDVVRSLSDQGRAELARAALAEEARRKRAE